MACSVSSDSPLPPLVVTITVGTSSVDAAAAAAAVLADDEGGDGGAPTMAAAALEMAATRPSAPAASRSRSVSGSVSDAVGWLLPSVWVVEAVVVVLSTVPVAPLPSSVVTSTVIASCCCGAPLLPAALLLPLDSMAAAAVAEVRGDECGARDGWRGGGGGQ